MTRDRLEATREAIDHLEAATSILEDPELRLELAALRDVDATGESDPDRRIDLAGARRWIADAHSELEALEERICESNVG